MKIIIAPDKFKGSLSAIEFCQAVGEGLIMAGGDHEILQFPMADGGDGLLEVLEYYCSYERVFCRALDPLFREIETFYLYDEKNKTAIIEMALISGLNLLKPEERNCMHTTSYGFGQLIRHALEKGAKNIFLGIGGSATNDGGIGMATALNYSFLDVNGDQIKTIGSELSKIDKINSSSELNYLTGINFTILSDVQNPWAGDLGAVGIFAEQKGASDVDKVILEKGMLTLAEKIKDYNGCNVFEINGAGAAGGMGGALKAFLNANFRLGADFVIEMSGIEQSMEDAHLLITGEGALDIQSTYGKVISRITSLAKIFDIECIAIVGKNLADPKLARGFREIYSIENRADNEQDSISKGIIYVKNIAYELGRNLR